MWLMYFTPLTFHGSNYIYHRNMATGNIALSETAALHGTVLSSMGESHWSAGTSDLHHPRQKMEESQTATFSWVGEYYQWLAQQVSPHCVIQYNS